jgi:hypothetical protein
MPALRFFFRRTDLNTDTVASGAQISYIDIVGFCLVAGVFLSISIVLIHYARKRSLARREDARGAAFLNVRGLVRDTENVREKREKTPLPQYVIYLYSGRLPVTVSFVFYV